MGILSSLFGSRDFHSECEAMISEQIVARNITSPKIIEAFRKIPRHLFVNKKDISRAYADHPLSIGFGQTISQPYIVALSIDALQLKGDEKILEIGTGSGYQTALLSLLSKEVYTVERIAELTESAKKRIELLEMKNIHFKIGDGSLGWSEFAPYDSIIVSAVAPKIPDALLQQLQENGKIVIPVGEENDQNLVVAEKTKAGLNVRHLCQCLFVKLIGEQGWQ